MLGRITVIFIPLLALSADVMEKFESDNVTYGDINVSHLDELYDVNREQYAAVLIKRTGDSPVLSIAIGEHIRTRSY